MSNFRILWGFRIDGLQDTASAVTGGLWFTHGKWAPPAKAGYVWLDALTSVPDILDEIDRNSGEFKSGAVMFGISATDRVAEMIEAFQVDATGILAGGGLDLTDNELYLEGGLILPTGLYWIGDEVVEVWGALSNRSLIRRGKAGTVASYHDAGDPVTKVPVEWRGLSCTMAIIDVFGDYSGTVGEVIEVWKGNIEDISDNLATYQIRCIGDWSYNSQAEANKKPRDWTRNGQFFQSGEVVWGQVDRPAADDQSGVLVRSIAVNGYAAQINGAVCYGNLIGGTVYFRAQPGAIRTTGDFYHPLRLGSGEFFETADGTETVGVDGPIFELAVVDRIGDQAGTRKISCTQALEHPYHPLSLCLALLVSDGSVDIANHKIFQANFGLGWGHLVDVAAWREVIDNTPELDEALDQWVGGWDGKPVKILMEVRKILRAFGFMAVRDSDCKIRVRSIQDLTLAGAKDAFESGVIPYRDSSFAKSRNLSAKSGRVYADVGELPFREAVRVEVETGRVRRRVQGIDNPVGLDLSVINRGRALVMAERLSSNAIASYFPAPDLWIRVENRQASQGKGYELLDFLALSGVPIQSAWWVDKDGTRRADVAGVLQMFGQITARKLLPSLGYELRISFSAFRSGRYARERAASLFVESVAGAVVTIADIGMGLPTDFEPGETVEFWTFGGELNSAAGVRTIVSATATTLTLNAAPAVSVDCNVIRVQQSAAFTSPKYDYFDDQRYVFGADSSGILRPSGTVDADVYGGRLGIGGAGGFNGYVDYQGDYGAPPAAADVREFAYLDDAVVDVDPGGAGSTPIDMFLVWRMLRNLARVASVGSHVQKREFSAFVGLGAGSDSDKQRCYASMDEFTIFSVPWLCQRGLRSIKTRAVLKVSRADGANLGSVGFRFELAGWREINFGIGATYDPILLADSWSAQNWDLEFEEFSNEVVTDLTLWAQSNDYSPSLQNLSSALLRPGSRLTATNVGDPSETNNNDPIDPDNLTLCCYREAEGGTLFDTLGLRASTSIVARPVSGLAPPPTGLYSRRAISFVQSKGWDLQEIYNPNAWVPAPSTFRAIDTVNASDDASLVTARRQLDQRYRCIWIGPTGRTVPLEREMPPNHHERFERILWDGSTDWNHWFGANISNDYQSSEFLCLVNFVPILRTSQVRTDGTFDSLQELGTVATWEIRALVEEFDGGIQAIATGEVDVVHYPTDVESPFLVLQAEACRRLNVTFDGSENYFSGSPHSIKEGRLSRQDRALINRFRIKIPAGAYGFLVGARIRFEARIKNSATQYRQGVASDPTSKLEGGLELVCTGATIWERYAEVS